jgi:hypothetical protein
MFEYMGSASPILAVVPAESEVARVLAEVGGAVRTDPGDIEAVVRVVKALVDGNDPALFSPRDSEQLQRYTRASTTASLAAVLESVCAGAPMELQP